MRYTDYNKVKTICREILIDDHFNNILVSLIAQGIQGKHIGIFLSQTGLSIKETQTFSPDGYSLRFDTQENNQF